MKETHLFGIEIHKLARDVLCQCKAMEAPSDCSLDDLFEIVLRMAAKLPGMAVMRLRHLGSVSTQRQRLAQKLCAVAARMIYEVR